MSAPACAGNANVLRRIRFAFERFKASARAGSYLAAWRRAARFAARGVEQDGVLLLTPREPSFTFVYVPLLLMSAAAGALLAAFG